jgi:hypothetical protein
MQLPVRDTDQCGGRIGPAGGLAAAGELHLSPRATLDTGGRERFRQQSSIDDEVVPEDSLHQKCHDCGLLYIVSIAISPPDSASSGAAGSRQRNLTTPTSNVTPSEGDAPTTA